MVHPIFIFGNRSDPQNCHLVALLSVVSESVGNLVNDVPRDFIGSSLLHGAQHGFRGHESSYVNLMEETDW